MMGIDDIFISFITSYITGMLPSLKEIFSKKQKDKQENMLQQLMEIDPDMGYPQEVSCKEIMEVYGLLKEIKGYIDWTNADNLDALCATRFESIVKKICEKRNQNLQKVQEHNYNGR